MRTGLLFLCLSLYYPVNIRAQGKKANTSSTTSSLAVLVSEHTDKDAVASLKKDLAASATQATLDKDIGIFSIDNWQRMMMWLIAGWSNGKVIPLPKDFFQLDTCKRSLAIEALGLAYGHLAHLDAEQTLTLAFFSQSGEDVDVNDEQEKQLKSILSGFEKLVMANMDKFANTLFSACPATEIRSLFPDYDGTAVKDQKKWTELTKKNAEEQFKEFRFMLENR